MTADQRIVVKNDADIVAARQAGRALAVAQGFGTADATLVATAISEVARNILEYAKEGEVVVRPVDSAGRRGVLVVAKDQGPGIADLVAAMRDGHSTGNGLGLGLPGARRMMDDFDIVSTVGAGTTITMQKWVPRTSRR